ncbi:adhesion G-protein coupled receptor G2 [Rhinophrynus dorsalis]
MYLVIHRMILWDPQRVRGDSAKLLPVRVKTLQLLCVLLCIMDMTQLAQTVSFKEFKAVFKTPCQEVLVLNSSVPSLKEFTVCTYIKLSSSNPWTAFIYKLPNSPASGYEIGLLGDSSSINISLFGTEINMSDKLNLNTWYETCIKWDSRSKIMEFYLDGNLKTKREMKNLILTGGGNVSLGCSQLPGTNQSAPIGLVGELYMFRMWNTSDNKWIKSCINGNVISWEMTSWIHRSAAIEQESALHCAKEENALTSNPELEISFNAATIEVNSGKTSTDPLGAAIAPLPSPPSPGTEFLSNTTLFSVTVSNRTITGNNYTLSITTTTSNNSTKGTNSTFSITTTNIATTGIGKNLNRLLFNPRVSNGNSTANNSSSSIPTTSNIVTTVTESIDNTSITTTFNSATTAKEDDLSCTVSDSQFANESLSEQHCNTSTPCNSSAVYAISFNAEEQECIRVKAILQNINSPESSTISPTGLPTSSLSETTAISSTSLPNSSLSENSTSTSLSTSRTSENSTFTSLSTSRTSENSTVLSTSLPKSTPQVNQSEVPTLIESKKNCTVLMKVENGSSLCSVVDKIKHQNLLNITTEIQLDEHCCCDKEECPSNVTELDTKCTRTKRVVICRGSAGSGGSSGGSDGLPSVGMPTSSPDTPGATDPEGTQGTDFASINDALTSPYLNASTVESIVLQLEKILSSQVQPDTGVQLVGVMNNFLNISQNLLTPVSRRLINIVDKIGLQLTFPEQSINITSKSLVLAVDKVNSSFFSGTSFSVQSSSGLQVSLGSQGPLQSDGSVVLPASLVNGLSPAEKDQASRIQFNFFEKTTLFMDSSIAAKQQYLVSKVISSSVSNLTITNLKDDVTVTLKTFPISNQTNVSVLCVFWDLTKNNGTGGWESNGCTVANTTQNETVCQCNHLTSFAILMEVSRTPLSPEDTLILTFITYIGCGLSAIFLSVTLVTYIAFEKIRRDYPSKILIQLCAALICLNLTFLLNPWIALYSDVPGLCISVAAFLHYFLLVSITWMGLEAFHMYLSLVKVFNTYVRKYILKFCIVGWGVPAVVVAIILAVNKDLYGLQSSGKYPNGTSDDFCWISSIVFYITVVGYFGIIFLMNVSMFIVVLIQLCRIKKQKQLGYQRKTTFQDMRSVAGITFLLGITWGLAFFSWGPGRVAVVYLFTIFNTLQGFFIFIFYCVAKENVRKQWKRYLCCGKFRLPENSDWSKTATHKLKKQTSKQGVSSTSSNSIQSSSNSNSTTLLVSNEYSLHPNGNGNTLKERNGVSFMLHNGEVPLRDFPVKASDKNGDAGEAQRTALRRTTHRGSVHFMDQK